MDKRCSPKQIAKAIILSAMDNYWVDYLIEHDIPAALKSLDTFVVTVEHFSSVFEKKFKPIYEKYSVDSFSEEQFLNFLAPRCETLSQKSDQFGLILTCSFVSEMLRYFRTKFECLHYDSPAYKYLSGLLESRFKSLENKSYWNRLLHYCRELNRRIYDRRHHIHHLPMEKPTTSASSDEDVGTKTTDESNIRKGRKSDTTRTVIKKLECPDIDKEEVMNISEHFKDDTDKRCGDMFSIQPSKVISDVSQNDEIELNTLQEINGSDIESNIGSSSIKDIDSRHRTISSEDSDDNWPTICTYFDLLMPDPEYKFEILGLIKECRTGFDYEEKNRANNELINAQMGKDISSSSATVCEESHKNFESKKNFDEPLIDSRRKIQTSVDEHECGSQSDTKEPDPKPCMECKGKNFKLRFRKWKMAFHMRYKNLNIVSDLFDRKQSNGSSSS